MKPDVTKGVDDYDLHRFVPEPSDDRQCKRCGFARGARCHLGIVRHNK